MNKLTTSTKLFYGLGFAGQGIKDGLFQLFLIYYFNNVMGLDPALAGTSALIALLFDAVSDPLVGILSDKYKSEKWGRRHPFMFWSAIPFGVFIWLLFMPPEGLGQMGLFYWMTAFTILVRIALTFFLVPGSSLGAELSTDFHERTSITSYRIMFASLFPAIIIFLGLGAFFTPTESGGNGLFNKAAYPQFSFFCGVLIIIIILVSTWGTRKTIPYLPKSTDEQQRLTFFQLLGGLKKAFKMSSYRTLLTYNMVIYASIGLGMALTTYYLTYYFGMTEKELAVLPIASAVGGIVGLVLGPWFGKKWDKKWGTIYSTVIFGVSFSLPFNLRMMDLFPENGSDMILPVYLLTTTIAYVFLWVALSLGHSMMAEVVDEYELETDTRQEGLFFSSLSFAYKCTVGLGAFLAGVILKVISFPKQKELSEVPQEAIDDLGFIGGPVSMTIYLLSVIFIFYYPITRERYGEIRRALDKKK